MLRIVTRRGEIDNCQRMLKAELNAALPNKRRLSIGYHGGWFENLVYFDENLWFSTKKLTGQDGEVPRYWNGFGLGKREGGHQIIVVEINPPLKGINRQVSGLFGRDERTDKYYILHRGGLGGGRKGIGKESFKAWYTGSWVEVYESGGYSDEAILVGPLGVRGLLTPLRAFVQEVSQFKDEAVSGSFGRTPPDFADDPTFHPESFGRRKGTRRATIDYESYHGLVVNRLLEWLKTQGIPRNARVFRTQLIDLGILLNGQLHHIFEVKSGADRQSVYTGTGQLFLHSKGDSNVGKTLVLPHRECPPAIKQLLSKLGINLIEYSIKGENVKFLP